MKYSNKQYAQALQGALTGKDEKKQKAVLKRFVQKLHQQRGIYRLNLILKEYEKKYLQEKGFIKVQLEYPEQLPAGIKKEVEKELKHKIYFLEKTNPKLLGGIKILINDEILVDATAKRQLDKIFSSFKQ